MQPYRKLGPINLAEDRRALVRAKRAHRQQKKLEAEQKERDRQRDAALAELAQILRAHLDADQILRVADLIDVAAYSVAQHLRGAE